MCALVTGVQTCALPICFRLDDALGIPGRFDLRYDGTHILKQMVSFEGIDGTVTNDLRGDLRDGSFKYRAQGSLSWRLDNFRIRWTTTYYGKIKDSNVLRDKIGRAPV